MMFGFWTHVILVSLCVGLGYHLRYIIDLMRELDEQIRRLTKHDMVKQSPGIQPRQDEHHSVNDNLSALKKAIKG